MWIPITSLFFFELSILDRGCSQAHKGRRVSDFSLNFGHVCNSGRPSNHETTRLRELRTSTKANDKRCSSNRRIPLAVAVSVDRDELRSKWLDIVIPSFFVLALIDALFAGIVVLIARSRSERAKAQQRAIVAQSSKPSAKQPQALHTTFETSSQS